MEEEKSSVESKERDIEKSLLAIMTGNGEISFVNDIDDCCNECESRTREELTAKGLSGDRLQRRVRNVTKSYRYWINQGREQLIEHTRSMFLNHQDHLNGAIEACRDGCLENVKYWFASGDCCDECEQLHGQKTVLDADFQTIDGKHLKHPPLHPGCRCSLSFSEVAPLIKRKQTLDVTSIHDNRMESAYRPINYSNLYVEGDFSWWTPEYDEIICRAIEKYQWYWYWEITNEIIKSTPSTILDVIKKDDNYYNRIMYFAESRAYKMGLLNRIREARIRNCPICKQPFREDSLPYSIARRLGIDALDFCSPCLNNSICSIGNDTANREEIINYLTMLKEIIQIIPRQDFGAGQYDLLHLSFDKRVRLIELSRTKPSNERIKDVFGSWFEALIYSGIIENGSRRTSRGTWTIAADGHVCYSLAEKTIDDFLFDNDILHEKEVNYPNSNLRCDFLVHDVFIEYFGLAGNEVYDNKIQIKKRICEAQGLKLLSLYPEDLISTSCLDKKLKRLTRNS